MEGGAGAPAEDEALFDVTEGTGALDVEAHISLSPDRLVVDEPGDRALLLVGCAEEVESKPDLGPPTDYYLTAAPL
jgi:hypothetical protein